MKHSRTYSAPGKVVIAGEYAVLEGYEALAMAIDGRVNVHVCRNSRSRIDLRRNKLVSCIFDAFLERGLDPSPLGITIDSNALCVKTSSATCKIGAGSSSAIAVALSAALVDAFALERSLILTIAQDAHWRFTNQRGSGIDVATSYCGGAISFKLEHAKPTIALLDDRFDTSHLVLVHTGVEQSTTALLSRVHHKRTSSHYSQIMRGMGEAAAYLISSLTRRDSDSNQVREAVAEHNRWMQSLERLADVKILCDEHKTIAASAELFSGSAKPSGAGGGDISLCFIEPDAHAAFAKDVSDRGFHVLPFKFCARGFQSH